MKLFPDVDAYITAAPTEAQPKLRGLRNLIQKTLPQAEEKIWYGVPFYHECGEVVGLSVSRRHVSVGFGAEVFSDVRRKEAESLGYSTGKCTLQIRFDQKIPDALIRQCLQAKVKWNRAKRKLPSGI